MRAIWTGSLSFGLVNIPVNLYPASRDKPLGFKLLHKKDQGQIHYARICEREKGEVPWEEIVKGYEVHKGEFIVLEDEDFKKARLKKTTTIEIIAFMERDEIDPAYFVRPYFLEPGKSADKSYSLLREAMKSSKKGALAKYVLKNREHIALIQAHGALLILHELRYGQELLSPKELKIPSAIKLSQKELDTALLLIKKLTAHFEPSAYKDTFVQEIKQLIKQKMRGRLVRSKKPKTKSAKVHDIMTLLSASLKPKKRTRKSA